ncbi:hypothetical protein EJ04DRAFT_476485 [Polyplosphaeria fusca]|uniref:Uncharacterized protein n=1 Tax=Polyplosphaeria fusca TaxID=682080 RepID=A0A9P4QP44_9PLEO|nr:hypothetical protein EJ04DRAFT_476485 [Polyplosphaeria fusca]
MLMRHKAAKQAGEPLFCIEDVGKVFFQGMDDIFQDALTDPALFHALSLTLAMAANNDVPNVECLIHRGKVLRHVGERLQTPAKVINTSTISAMLLLIGYEYRAQEASRESVTVQLRAVDEVAKYWRSSKRAHCDLINRALFWQDLMSCVILDTPRFLSYDIFLEFIPTRDNCPMVPESHVLRPGLLELTDWLPIKMITLLEDLNALCDLVDTRCTGEDLPVKKMQIDNGQGWLESRLGDCLSELRASGQHNPIYEACIYAAYLSTYKLSTSIWEGILMPEFCASQILRLLQTAGSAARFEPLSDLVTWLLFAGGTFAANQRTKLAFTRAILGKYRVATERCVASWDALKETLTRFVWCSHVMERPVLRFWDGMHPENPLNDGQL